MRQATFLLAEYSGERQEEEGDVCMCVGVEEEELLISGCFSLQPGRGWGAAPAVGI